MKILCLGMFGNMGSELSYEARMVHHLASIPGNEVDYWTDQPLSYSSETVLRQPSTLRNFVFHEGERALMKTPRQFHPLDLKRIINEHTNPRMKWPMKLKAENMGPMGTDLQVGTIIDPEKLPKPYDVIFATAQTGIDMGVPLKQILDVPLVVQILDVPWWRLAETGPSEIYKFSVIPLPLLPHELFDGYRSEWQGWFSQLGNVDRVTTILEKAKEFIVDFSGCGRERISVTHHGSIDQETFDYYLAKEKVERKHQLLCIPEGSIVMGNPEARPIQDFKIGDSVLGRSGFVRIKQVFKRDYDGPVTVIKAKGFPECSLTPEHPVLVRRSRWVHHSHRWPTHHHKLGPEVWKSANDVAVGDWMVVPRLKTDTPMMEEIAPLDISKYKNPHERRHTSVPDKLAVSTELSELLGWYLAEGSTSSSTIYFALNQNESMNIERIRNLIRSLFGEEARTKFKGGGCNIWFCSAKLCRALVNWFGERAASKKIPPFIFDWSLEQKIAFLTAYSKGDGYLNPAGYMSLVTASRGLAHQLILFLHSLGIRCTLEYRKNRATVIKGRATGEHPIYRVGFATNQIASRTKRSVKQSIILEDSVLLHVTQTKTVHYKGKVYNFHTEDGTYCAPLATVHNCINRIDFHKGVDESVLVCRVIQDIMGDKAPEFVFVSTGNQEWYVRYVKEYARQHLKRYRFTGWVSNSEKIRLIRESKVMLDNEWPEGFGGCMIQEGIYCNTPVVSWDRESKKELHPLPGLTRVPPLDYRTMAEKAAEILFREPWTPDPVTEADRQFIAKYRSNRSHAEGVDRVLREVVGK